MRVKLLFDQNLSPKLIKRLAELYPNSDQLDLLGLGTAKDVLVWEHARNNDFVVVTKDADLADLSVLRGFPPKVGWIRRGNCSTSNIEEILRDHNAQLKFSACFNRLSAPVCKADGCVAKIKSA